MDNIQFEKMHGLGNDFVIIDARAQTVPDHKIIKKMADRNRGIGFDQLVIISGTDPIKMDIYNGDGSLAEACGNVSRCVGKYLYDQGHMFPIEIKTNGGLITIHAGASEHTFTVDMGKPKRLLRAIPAEHVDIDPKQPADHVTFPPHQNTPSFTATLVNMGNPHAVLFGDEDMPHRAESWGPGITVHPSFPEQINAGFAHITPNKHIRLRVHERGAGVTQACGTGACAAVVAAVDTGLLQGGTHIVDMDGGSLLISYTKAPPSNVMMEGPVSHVFSGVWHEH